MKHITLRRLFAISILLASVTPAWAQHGIEVTEPWVREAPPTARVLAAYMVLHNHSDQERKLMGVTSPAFGFAELHKTMEHDGMAHMEQVDEIIIPPHGKVELGPGKLHIMLIDPTLQLKAGDTVSLTLSFRNDKSIKVIAPVRKAEGMSHEHHDHHDMHKDMNMMDEHKDHDMQDMKDMQNSDMHSDHHH